MQNLQFKYSEGLIYEIEANEGQITPLFPIPPAIKIPSRKLCMTEMFLLFLFYRFHHYPKGGESLEGYVEHAVYARILVLPPRNFLHPDEIQQFAYSFCNCSKIYWN